MEGSGTREERKGDEPGLTDVWTAVSLAGHLEASSAASLVADWVVTMVERKAMRLAVCLAAR